MFTVVSPETVLELSDLACGSAHDVERLVACVWIILVAIQRSLSDVDFDVHQLFANSVLLGLIFLTCDVNDPDNVLSFPRKYDSVVPGDS